MRLCLHRRLGLGGWLRLRRWLWLGGWASRTGFRSRFHGRFGFCLWTSSTCSRPSVWRRALGVGGHRWPVLGLFASRAAVRRSWMGSGSIGRTVRRRVAAWILHVRGQFAAVGGGCLVGLGVHLTASLAGR